MPWPLTSRTMRYEFLPAVGCALFFPAVGLLFSPAVGPLFFTCCGSALFGVASAIHHVVLHLRHLCLSINRPLPSQPKSSGFLIRGLSTQSGGFTHGLVGAAVGCLTFFVVRHALRDVLMAFHELLGGELFAHARSFTCCAWLAGLARHHAVPSSARSAWRSRRYPAPVRSR